MTMNKVMVYAGVCTLLQAVGQMIFTSLGLAQHFCVIDFLKELPLLIYIRVLYFHNPSGCGSRINIGQAVEGVVAQAFVLLQNEPFTAFRTFIINCIGLSLSVLWAIVSVILVMGGANNKTSKHARWPWIVVTVAVCAVDLIATVTYANDTFHTRTLSDIMDFIGGSVSGIGNTELNTAWASWTMVLLYSRFVIFYVVNVFFVISMVVEFNVKRETIESTVMEVEAPAISTPPIIRHNSFQHDVDDESSTPSVLTTEKIPRPGLSHSFRKMKTMLFRSQTPEQHRTHRDPESLGGSPESIRRTERIPRPGLTNSFRRMKTLLFRKSPPRDRTSKFYTDSCEVSPERRLVNSTHHHSRSPQTQHAIDKNEKRTVNFPENLLSLPQRLENMIAEQQKRLDNSVIDTAGRGTPRASQSAPHLDSTNLTDGRGRRGTTAELQGQLPWAYIPASAHRMRDQLPPDEDLPPVPLPDYTAIPSFRKASVHRAASSLSSLTQKRDYTSQSTRPPLTQSDVLY